MIPTVDDQPYSFEYYLYSGCTYTSADKAIRKFKNHGFHAMFQFSFYEGPFFSENSVRMQPLYIYVSKFLYFLMKKVLRYMRSFY